MKILSFLKQKKEVSQLDILVGWSSFGLALWGFIPQILTPELGSGVAKFWVDIVFGLFGFFGGS